MLTNCLYPTTSCAWLQEGIAMFAAVNIISLPGGGGGYAGRWEGGRRTCPEPTGWQLCNFFDIRENRSFQGETR